MGEYTWVKTPKYEAGHKAGPSITFKQIRKDIHSVIVLARSSEFDIRRSDRLCAVSEPGL
jgi:hypothetical protein